MGSCTSKLNVNSGTPDANHVPENIPSRTNAKKDQNQAVGKPKTFTINREQEDSGSTLSLDTRIHTYESVSDEEEEKEKLYEVSIFLSSFIIDTKVLRDWTHLLPLAYLQSKVVRCYGFHS
jgi:hypothetical protein